MENKNNEDNNSNELAKEQADIAIMIESLVDETLKKLKEGDTNVDIETLMETIKIYSSYPSFHEPSVVRWKEKLAEITLILEAHYKKLEEELQTMVKNNPQVSAYDKANNLEEE